MGLKRDIAPRTTHTEYILGGALMIEVIPTESGKFKVGILGLRRVFVSGEYDNVQSAVRAAKQAVAAEFE